MKFTFAVATLVAISSAYYLDEFVKDKPKGMGRAQRRWKRVGRKRVLDEQANYRKINRKCRKNVKHFDAYCHNAPFGGDRLSDLKLEYAKYTDKNGQCSRCDMGDDGLCLERELEPKQFHCIAQQCAFDYCIWYRDNYIEACE